MIVRNFQKGKVHNLYDKNKHTTLHGVLFFNVQDEETTTISEHIEESEKKEVPEILIYPRNRAPLRTKSSVSDGLEQTIIKDSKVSLEDKREETLIKKVTFIEQLFNFAFRIDKLFIALFKLFLWIFDSIFTRVDNAIYWFDHVVIEQRFFRLPKIPFGKLKFKLEPRSKKTLFEQAVKKAVEENEKDKQSLTSSEDKQILTSSEDKKKKKESSQKSKFSFSLPKINLSYLFLAYPKVRLTLAAICFLISLGSISLLMFPLVSAEVYSRLQMMSDRPAPTPTPITYNSYYQEEKDKLYPITEFRLSVPKINLESNIVDNVDPKIEDEYKQKLQFGVAHAKGSYLPPENGPVYLFAHSTDTVFNIARFNAKFFSVRELEKGDEINVYFNGTEYSYVVEDKYVINPKEVDIIQQAKTDLILQTCWPPGTDWQRLIVTANRKDKVRTQAQAI